jgi:hypothetical protein
MSAVSVTHTVREHFAKCAPVVEATYARIIDTAKAFGPVKEEPKKTTIHLVRKTAFAGIATRKSSLILTLKSDRDLESSRIIKRERASANRWHLEVRVETPDQIDTELVSWLKKAYELAGLSAGRTVGCLTCGIDSNPPQVKQPTVHFHRRKPCRVSQEEMQSKEWQPGAQGSFWLT